MKSVFKKLWVLASILTISGLLLGTHGAVFQALDAKGDRQDGELADLQKKLDTKMEELRALQERLARLESLVGQTTSEAAKR